MQAPRDGQESGHDVSDEGSHDSSRPPPPPSRRAEFVSDPEVAENARVGRSRSKLALATAEKALAVGQRIEAAVGHSPDPARKIEGAGLLGAVTTLIATVDGLKKSIEDERRIAAEVLKAEQEKASKRGTVFRWIFAVIAAIGGVLGIVKATR